MCCHPSGTPPGPGADRRRRTRSETVARPGLTSRPPGPQAQSCARRRHSAFKSLCTRRRPRPPVPTRPALGPWTDAPHAAAASQTSRRVPRDFACRRGAGGPPGRGHVLPSPLFRPQHHPAPAAAASVSTPSAEPLRARPPRRRAAACAATPARGPPHGATTAPGGRCWESPHRWWRFAHDARVAPHPAAAAGPRDARPVAGGTHKAAGERGACRAGRAFCV
jgi:hypothetical protein